MFLRKETSRCQKDVYSDKIRNIFWRREVSEKVFLRALYSKFSHFSIQYIANMSFSQFCMYFRFKYTPLVNTTMVYEKGSIYVFLASRSFGEIGLEHFIAKFSHFSIQYIANMSFSQFCMYFRFKYTPLVKSTIFMKKEHLEPFGVEKFRRKCFLEHFTANFHIFPYNTLQTCHFHNFVCIFYEGGFK